MKIKSRFIINGFGQTYIVLVFLFILYERLCLLHLYQNLVHLTFVGISLISKSLQHYGILPEVVNV